MNSIITILAVVLFQNLQAAPAVAVTPTPLPPTCNGTLVISPPNDLTKPYYWPAGWNENMNAPPHTVGLVCTFMFKVPRGLYAKLVMKGQIYGDGEIFLNDDAHYNQHMYTTNLEPYFFVNNGFYVSLSSGTKFRTEYLGLKVVWSHFPTATPDRITIRNGFVTSQPTKTASNGLLVLTNSGSRVSLLPLPMNSINLNSLRNTLVFDGPSYYANYTGNLYKIFASRKQFVSTGNNLTIITFEPQNTQDFYIAQDYKDTKNIAQYTTVICDENMSCPVTLDANNGKAAAISISIGGETLTDATISRDASLSVYSGIISNTTLLDEYNYSSTMTSLPRKYYVNTRQYVFDKGIATLGISRK